MARIFEILAIFPAGVPAIQLCSCYLLDVFYRETYDKNDNK